MSAAKQALSKQPEEFPEDIAEFAGLQMSPLILSARDWQVLINALSDTETPRPKLTAAMKRYLEWKNT